MIAGTPGNTDGMLKKSCQNFWKLLIKITITRQGTEKEGWGVVQKASGSGQKWVQPLNGALPCFMIHQVNISVIEITSSSQTNQKKTIEKKK